MLTRLLTALALLVAVSTLSFTPSADQLNKPELRTIAGDTSEWQQYLDENSWLLVKIWAANCVICNQTAHEIVDLQQRRAELGLQIVGIALTNGDDLTDIEDYIIKHKLKFDNLLDNGEFVANIYRTSTGEQWGGWTPTFLLFNPHGEIAAKNIGPVRASDITRFIHNYTG